MGTRKLGPSGSEITLPSIGIALPIAITKKVERAEMSDGSGRYAFFEEYRGWELTFPKLTKAQLDSLIALRAENDVLRWQNDDESTTWYNVVITDFKYDTSDPASPTVYYFASMTLEQVI